MIKFILNNIPARKFDVRVVSLAPNELLKGRVALITGGTSGIGFHMAKAFLRSGAAVVITGRSEERLRLACGELNEDDHYKGRLFGLVMDNTRVDLFHDRFQKALDKVGSGGFPHIDILVNNAGVRRDNLMVFMPGEDWDSVLGTGLGGFYNVTQPLLQPMLVHKFGRIVNMASVSGLRGMPRQANYSAAKGGIIAATKALAQEVARKNVTVNAVAPGFIRTDMVEGLDEAALKKTIPVGRFGMPEEVAGLVGFLVSRDADYITGEVIAVNGGLYT